MVGELTDGHSPSNKSSHGRNDVMDRIEQGRRIVVEYNDDQLYEEMFIRFVITIDRSSVIP